MNESEQLVHLLGTLPVEVSIEGLTFKLGYVSMRTRGRIHSLFGGGDGVDGFDAAIKAMQNPDDAEGQVRGLASFAVGLSKNFDELPPLDDVVNVLADAREGEVVNLMEKIGGLIIASMEKDLPENSKKKETQ